MNPIIIGLAGRAGAGKDTVAELLTHSGRLYVTVAFADPLRDMLTRGLGLESQRLVDRDLKEQPIDWLGRSPRHLMQTLGTEWGRNLIHPEIWVKLAERRIRQYVTELGDYLHGIIVTDVRFDEEASMIRRLGGTIWHILRPGTDAPPTHISESGVSPHHTDRMLCNDRTVADLRQRVLVLEREFLQTRRMASLRETGSKA